MAANLVKLLLGLAHVRMLFFLKAQSYCFLLKRAIQTALNLLLSRILF